MAKKLKKEEEPKPVFRNEDADITVENRLKALYKLQKIESEIDKIRIIRGELPLQVEDLEDTIAGLTTRISKLDEQEKELEAEVSGYKNDIIDHQENIKKYETQQGKVKNNREFESLAKEIEFQQLEIQLCEKRIREANRNIEALKESVAKYNHELEEKQKDLEVKKSELDDILKDTSEKEAILTQKAEEEEKHVEDRYLTAFKRIRKNAKNGLAVVTVDRGSCGGCFNRIAHQRQMEIQMHKKIIVCEYCGRILVDDTISEEINNQATDIQQ
ncbi:MAG: C4-type zinc ribbon domain-containing protein [Bacteroidota bacterium]|nr:C4-type zinc ribbon domain-containing protein [Bacteroidota bacterium]